MRFRILVVWRENIESRGGGLIKKLEQKGDRLHREPRKNDLSLYGAIEYTVGVPFFSIISFFFFFLLFLGFPYYIFSFVRRILWRILPRRRAHDQEIFSENSDSSGEQTLIDHPLDPAAFTEKDDAAHTTTYVTTNLYNRSSLCSLDIYVSAHDYALVVCRNGHYTPPDVFPSFRKIKSSLHSIPAV